MHVMTASTCVRPCWDNHAAQVQKPAVLPVSELLVQHGWAAHARHTRFPGVLPSSMLRAMAGRCHLRPVARCAHARLAEWPQVPLAGLVDAQATLAHSPEQAARDDGQPYH